MEKIAITNILNSYGFNGPEPQYKTINYSIIPKHKTLEDHIEKPQLEILQQLNEEKKSRELVEVYGITLEKTKQFYADKIKEYNDIIDLKHIKKKRIQSQFVEKQNNQTFVRFAGDEGKITNFHISINSNNLIPLFNEISRRASNQKSQQQSPNSGLKRSNRNQQNSTSKTSNNYTNIKNTIQTINSKQICNITSRLEQKFNNLDRLNLSQINQVNFIEDPSLNLIKKRNSLSINLKFKGRNTERKKTNQFIKHPIQDFPKIDLSQMILDSFRQNQYTSCQQEEDSETSQKNVRINQYNNLEITQIQQQQLESQSELNKTINLNQVQKDYLPDIYQDIRINQNIDMEQRKKILQRRRQVVHDILHKQKPKFLHICGSKFPVVNNEQNWYNYESLRTRIIQRELEKEIIKMRNQKEQQNDLENLSILSGPPINSNFNTNNLQSDYQDVKITKIMKQLAALKQ